MQFTRLSAAILVALAGLSARSLAADSSAAPAPPQPPAQKAPPTQKGSADKKPADKKPAEKKPACRVCGGGCHLTPVCVCEPATKKKTKTTYSMKCEPVCVPEPCLSHHGHHGNSTRHAGSCTGTACDGSCGAASVRTKKILLKTMKEEEVDVIERKVEYLCRHCADHDAAPTCSSCAGHGPASASRPWWKSLWLW